MLNEKYFKWKQKMKCTILASHIYIRLILVPARLVHREVKQEHRKILGVEEEAKSSRGTSIPTSFVFSTIQFTPVHLHLHYFHSNSRGAIRSIFDIGTWLWKRACHFSVNRWKKTAIFPPCGVKVGFFKQNSTLSDFFYVYSSPLLLPAVVAGTGKAIAAQNRHLIL